MPDPTIAFRLSHDERAALRSEMLYGVQIGAGLLDELARSDVAGELPDVYWRVRSSFDLLDTIGLSDPADTSEEPVDVVEDHLQLLLLEIVCSRADEIADRRARGAIAVRADAVWTQLYDRLMGV